MILWQRNLGAHGAVGLGDPGGSDIELMLRTFDRSNVVILSLKDAMAIRDELDNRIREAMRNWRHVRPAGAPWTRTKPEGT